MNESNASIAVGCSKHFRHVCNGFSRYVAFSLYPYVQNHRGSQKSFDSHAHVYEVVSVPLIVWLKEAASAHTCKTPSNAVLQSTQWFASMGEQRQDSMLASSWHPAEPEDWSSVSIPFLAQVSADVTALPVWQEYNYKAGSVHQCAQLPQDTIVIVLPSKIADLGWSAVLCRDPTAQTASFAWVHPLSLRRIRALPSICIKHCQDKRQHGPDFPLGEFSLLPCKGGGTVYHLRTGQPALDCRFADRYQSETNCNGWCVRLVEKLIETDLSKVLKFLQVIVEHGGRTYDIFCQHACHRSVAVGNFLYLFAGCRLQYGHASRRRNCCQRLPAEESMYALCEKIRELPLVKGCSLSLLLRLPNLPD